MSYEGKVVRIRPVRREDRASSLRWRNDPELREMVLGYRWPITEVMEDQWYDRVLQDNKSKVVYAIETIPDDLLSGFILLDRIDWVSAFAWLGILVGEKEKQGRGLAREAMDLFFPHVFGCLNLRKICLEVAAYNERAVRLYERYGFVREGTLREQVYYHNYYHDVVLMALFKEQYNQRSQGKP